MIIKVRNTLTDIAEKTFLTNPEVSGTNVLRWKNPDPFSPSWAMQIGETGESQSEIVLLGLSNPAGTAGTLTANTLYEHPSDTPLYAIKYDQVVFERSTAGTAGTATPMTNGTITIQPNLLFTLFDDTTGSASYGYKTYFRNSVLNATTTESDWITSAGFDFYALGNMRQRVKDALWNAEFLTDDQIDSWINEWKDELTNAVIQVNQDFAMGTVDVGFSGVSTPQNEALGTITNVDFKQVRRVWISTDGGQSWYKSTKMDSNSFTPNQLFNATHPYHYFQGDSVFAIKPSDQSGTARFEYYKLNAALVNDGDDLPFPMRGYTKSFVDYGLARASFKDGKLQEAQMKIQEANQAKAQFVSEMAPRDKSGPTYIDIIETTSGEDGFWFGWLFLTIPFLHHIMQYIHVFQGLSA